ncbi:MAG: anaphase promoting complex subunit doc1 [Stictis urceolatum]|nr:anaphase promoting complex subunit doc1 [Stictis urceolata]
MAGTSPPEVTALSNPSETALDGDEAEDILSPPLSSLREISTLASWTVSTYKPGCGVAALRSPSPTQFWQSDGPQPHLLNIHFFKLVSIARLRIYLDLESDESYTPTRMQFLAGHSEYDVVEFAEWRSGSTPEGGPRGWVDIGLERCWGRGGEGEEDVGVDGEGEGVLRCMFLQVKVLENHQNGKDTHIRGVQIWAKDEREGRRVGRERDGVGVGKAKGVLESAEVWEDEVEAWIEDGIGDAEIR